MKYVDAIILAGGLGTRLQSVVPDTPKVLAPVNGKPFLEILLFQIAKMQHVKKVILSLGYRAQDVVAHVDRQAAKFPFAISFSIEQEPLGTGGATSLALQRAETDPVLIMNGDTYVELDLPAFLSHHVQHQAQVSIAVQRVADTSRYGKINLDDATHRILSFEEKKACGPGYVNAGVLLLNKNAIEGFPLGKSFSLEKDVFPQLISKGVYGWEIQGRFIDMGTPESYAFTQKVFGE